MFKAVIFDYNGVLINDLPVHEEAYLMAAKEVSLPITREIIRRHISTTAQQKRELYFGDISDQTWKRIFHLKTDYYFKLITKRDLVFPEVEDVLLSLKKRYLLGLISNTSRLHFEKVFPDHLACLFQTTIFGDEVVHPKPSLEPLIKIMGRLNVSTDQCCCVGDSISDVEMAKRAGIKIFAVTTGDNSKEDLVQAGPDWILDRLSELKDRLMPPDPASG